MAERFRYQEHLGGCPVCRQEVVVLAGLRALLARLRIDESPNYPRTG